MYGACNTYRIDVNLVPRSLGLEHAILGYVNLPLDPSETGLTTRRKHNCRMIGGQRGVSRELHGCLEFRLSFFLHIIAC